jgi:drug/metabolite transporter (DMT)-like permease
MNDQDASNMDQVKKQVLSFTRGEFFFAVGMLLAVLCFFLPWVTVDIPKELRDLAKAAGERIDTTSMGFEAGWRGWFTFIGGLLCAGVSIFKPVLAGKLDAEQMKMLSKATPIAGLVVFGIVLISFFDVAGADHANVGIGLWLAMLGTLAAAASVVVSNYFADKPFAAFFAAPMFGK